MMESKMTDMMLDQNIRRLTETDINVLENAKSPPPSTPRDPLIDTINTTIEWEHIPTPYFTFLFYYSNISEISFFFVKFQFSEFCHSPKFVSSKSWISGYRKNNASFVNNPKISLVRKAETRKIEENIFHWFRLFKSAP